MALDRHANCVVYTDSGVSPRHDVYGRQCVGLVLRHCCCHLHTLQIISIDYNGRSEVTKAESGGRNMGQGRGGEANPLPLARVLGNAVIPVRDRLLDSSRDALYWKMKMDFPSAVQGRFSYNIIYCNLLEFHEVV